MSKERYTMVLCYKCFEEKHGECMGKAGLFDCDCESCTKQTESQKISK